MENLVKNRLLRWIIFMEFICVGSFFTVKLLKSHLGWANVVLIVLAVYIVVVLMKVKRKYPKAPGWWRFYKGMGYFMTGYLAIFALCVFIYGVTFVVDTQMTKSGKKYYTSAEANAMIVEAKGESILEQMDLLMNLKPDIYRTLDIMEKVEVLNRVVQIEAEYLGIEAPVLQVTELESGVVGRYRQGSNIVLINELYLPYEETTLTGVLHELYHAYQYSCIALDTSNSDLLFFRQVEQWRKEYEDMETNTHTREGHLSYYMQDIEISARKYAEDRINEYGKIIVIGNTP